MGWRLLWLLCAGGAAWSKTLRGGFVSSAARLEPWRPVARFQFRGRCPPGSGTSAGKKRYGGREEYSGSQEGLERDPWVLKGKRCMGWGQLEG